MRPEVYHEINNFYTATVYEKGAEVVRMLQDAARRRRTSARGMDLYFERHDGEAATVEDFVQCFADASGRDLAQFMRWYRRPARRRSTCDGATMRTRKTYALDVAQTMPPTPGQPVKQPMPIPLALRPGRPERRAICR